MYLYSLGRVLLISSAALIGVKTDQSAIISGVRKTIETVQVQIGRTYVTRCSAVRELLPARDPQRNKHSSRGLIPGESVSDPSIHSMHCTSIGSILKVICVLGRGGTQIFSRQPGYSFRSSVTLLQLRCMWLCSNENEFRWGEAAKPNATIFSQYIRMWLISWVWEIELTPSSVSRLVHPSSLFTDMPPLPPPPPGFPPPTSPPPGFPPPPPPGDKPGLCGLTGNQWHMVMIFSIPCKCAITLPHPSLPFILKNGTSFAVFAVLIILLIVLVISWLNSSEITFIWLRAQERAKTARMGTFPFLFHMLYDSDELSITVDANTLKGCARGYSDTCSRKTTSAAGASLRGPPLPRGVFPSSTSSLPSSVVSRCNVNSTQHEP